MKAFFATIAALLIAATGYAQGFYPPDLPDAGLPQAGDVGVVWRVGQARALKMTLPNWRTGVSPLTVTAQCLGVNDTILIDDAVSKAQSLGLVYGGAIVELEGTCYYSGAGIVNDPVDGLESSLVIAGNGTTTLTFSGCSNPQCILLSSQTLIMGFNNRGSGIRDITIESTLPAKPLVVLHNLESFAINNVSLGRGSNVLTISESRFGTVSGVDISQTDGGSGIKIIGETYAENVFSDILIKQDGTGSGFVYSKTGTVDAGVLMLRNVRVAGTFEFDDSGFKFSSSSAGPMRVHLSDCVADGGFSVAAFNFTNVSGVLASNLYGRNTEAGSNAPALLLDNVADVTVAGGAFYANTGASGSDISLKNSVATTVINGTRLTGPTLGVRVDGTTHEADLRASYYATTFTNDATKILPRSPAIGVVPVAGDGGTIAAGFLPAPSAATLGGVQSKSSVTSEWLKSLSTSGVFTSTQPAFSDLSGSHTCAQSPALTGFVTTSAGSCATTLAGVVSTANGGTGEDSSASSGVPKVSLGLWTFNAGIGDLDSSTSSALRGVLSDEVGTGAAVFSGALATVATSGLAADLLSAAGNYTPTLTGVANVAALGSRSSPWSRSGGTVTVSMSIDVDPTTGSTETKVGISLPVASALTALGQLNGIATVHTGTAILGGSVTTDATNDRAELAYFCDSSAATKTVTIVFTYPVI